MRPLLVTTLLLLSALALLPPPASAACAEGPQDRYCVAEYQDAGLCLASAETPGLDQCVVYVEGAFDPTGYYLVICAAEGDVDVCFTDSDGEPKCVRVLRLRACPME